MLEVKMQNFYINIDLIDGKSFDLGITLYSDDIEELIMIQRLFNNYEPKKLFKYISENIK